MSDQKPLNNMKKTFFYNFFSSTDDEEESCKVNDTLRVVTRKLVEMRDLYSALEISLTNPWQIMKKITRDEVVLGKVEISFFETFEYILRYWEMDVTKILVDGNEVCADVCDVTEENNPKKYEGGSVCLRKLYNDDSSLLILELFNDRGLGAGDEIGLYWDPRTLGLMFKIFSQVRPQ